MEARINYAKVAPGVIQAMLALPAYLRKSGLEESLVTLVCLRASQINGCACCIARPSWICRHHLGQTVQRRMGAQPARGHVSGSSADPSVSHAGYLPRHLGEPAQRVDQPHLLDRACA
jgi:alkylhydroperoxidase family enzyme